MSDINPLSSSSYYAGIQTSATEISKEKKKEKINKNSNVKFSELVKEQNDKLYTPSSDQIKEIQNMDIEEAVVFLKDKLDISGNEFANSPTTQNLETFRKNVKNFIQFLLDNNFEITKSRPKSKGTPSRLFFFSNYSVNPPKKLPRTQINIINKKLDELARITLQNQNKNLKLLDKVNEIKGLIVDLIQS